MHDLDSIILRHELHPDDTLIVAATDMYCRLMKDDPSFIVALSGRLDLASQMARAVITPLARVSGELYTATDAQGTLVGCAIWAPPGRTTFDTPEQIEMGILDFLANLDEEGKRYQEEVIGKTLPGFIDETIGVQKAEQNTYWCWFAMVREDYQGKGICHRMFNMVYDKAKATGATMGLLTSQEANVAKYERMGLKLKGQMDVHSPWGDFTFYSMSRDTEGE